MPIYYLHTVIANNCKSLLLLKFQLKQLHSILITSLHIFVIIPFNEFVLKTFLLCTIVSVLNTAEYTELVNKMRLMNKQRGLSMNFKKIHSK